MILKVRGARILFAAVLAAASLLTYGTSSESATWPTGPRDVSSRPAAETNQRPTGGALRANCFVEWGTLDEFGDCWGPQTVRCC